MCLCGMLAAEYATLPPAMQEELRRFFDANEAWLAAVLDEGRRSGELYFPEQPEERARVFVGALEGAMLMARSYMDDRRFRSAAEYLMADLEARAARPRKRQARKATAKRAARR
jgi:TetR/AcrR family transcriptional regulator, transcriptional repressor for nem operon